MIAPMSFVLRNGVVLLIAGLVIPTALVGCRRAESSSSGTSPTASLKPDHATSEAANLVEGTGASSMPPEEVFKRALWRRPAPEDTILHAERREWPTDQTQGVDRWQWFLAVKPGPSLKKWLREQNPFSVSPVGYAEAPVMNGAPAWFPSDLSDYIIHTGGTTGSLVFLWSRRGDTLYATGSGTGFAPGVSEPVTPASMPSSVPQGRLPPTPPPIPPKP
jgi:hypothetical protein